MRKIILFGLVLLLGLLSCKDNAVAYSNQELMLEKVVDSNIDVDFASLGYNMTAIPLNLPDSIFLSGNTHVLYVSQIDGSFFASDGKLIYKFDRDGNLTNNIGVIGHGPMEYQNIYSVSFDSEEKMAYIYAGNNTIYVYTFDGIPSEVVKLESDGYIGGAFRIKDGYWAETLNVDKGKTSISITKYNNDGKRTDDHVLTSFEANSNPDYYPSPIVNQHDGCSYNYYCPYNAKLYNISSEGIKSILTIDGGKYASTGNQINDMDFKTAHRDKFAEILDLYQSEESIFLLYTIGRKVYAGIVDKVSGKCVCNFQTGNPMRGGGLKISDNTEIKIWPQYVSRHNLYSINFSESDGNSSPDGNEDSADEPVLLTLNK